MNSLGRAALMGSIASIASTAALSLLAKTESKSAVQPTNATSHWLHGERADAVTQIDAAHTGLGFATHHASAIFWAVLFEKWLALRPPRAPAAMLRDACVMSAVAAIVDYGITPPRLTPGWESVLPPRKIAIAFASMAAGLTIGALLTEGSRHQQQ